MTEPTYREHRVRLYNDGRVEMLVRLDADSREAAIELALTEAHQAGWNDGEAVRAQTNQLGYRRNDYTITLLKIGP